MGWLKNKIKKHYKGEGDDSSSSSDSERESSKPPAWSAAPQQTHDWGRYTEASNEEYDAGERFCDENPAWAPRLLPSEAVERLSKLGCIAWGLERPTVPGFAGRVSDVTDSADGLIHVVSEKKCEDTTILSNWPIMGGLYDIGGKEGVYFEVVVHQMGGVIAIGMACKPYPQFRLPGWNRLSAALHLDDFRKFYQDPDGGMDSDFPQPVNPGDTVGCGYSFHTTSLFFTYNGQRLPDAFSGLYVPRTAHDVYAAIGVFGDTSLAVNFGAAPFRWKEANEWRWRVEGHVGRLSGPGPSSSSMPMPQSDAYARSEYGGFGDELPTYAQARASR